MSRLSPIHLLPFTDQAPLIVVIDDSALIRKLVEIALGREGCAVRSFPDGIKALRAFSEPTTRLPDLILLDIILPHIDGYAVAHSLRMCPRTAHIPIVMLSRRCGIVDRLKARLAGARAYLTKPVTTQALFAVVEQFIPGQLKTPPFS